MSSKRGKKRHYEETTHNINSDDVHKPNNESPNKKNEAILKEVQEMKKLITEMDDNYQVQKKELSKTLSKKNNSRGSAGIHCVKFSDSEYIFDFISNDDGKTVTYTVQIFNHNKKGELGKVNLPMGIDMQRILSETPLDDLKQASKFLKNCKRHIDFYHERKKQFKELQSYVQNSVNCFVDTNFNYTVVNLQLLKVYNSEKNIYSNLFVYLLYDLTDSKPSEMKFDFVNEKKTSNDTMSNSFESLFECFKSMTLKDALEDLIKESHATIQWNLKFCTDNLQYSLDSSDSSKSDDKNVSHKENSRTKVTKKKVETKKNHRKQQNTSNTPIKKSNVQSKNLRRSVSFENSRITRSQVKKSNTRKPLRQSKLSFIIEKSTEQDQDSRKNSKKRKRLEVEEATKIRKSPLKAISDEREENPKKNLNDDIQVRKMNLGTVLTSTPLQTHTKSILKQAMRYNLDISDIKRTESMPPPNKTVVKKKQQVRKKN